MTRMSKRDACLMTRIEEVKEYRVVQETWPTCEMGCRIKAVKEKHSIGTETQHWPVTGRTRTAESAVLAPQGYKDNEDTVLILKQVTVTEVSHFYT